MRTAAVFLAIVLYLSTGQGSEFQVSLELQWEYCSDSLTLICSHNSSCSAPFWVHNGTSASGVALADIPGAVYTESTSTRHIAVINGMENVSAVDGFTFQCVFHRLNSIPVRSSIKQYYWGYAEVSNTPTYDTSTSYCNYSCAVNCSTAPMCDYCATQAATDETVFTAISFGIEYIIIAILGGTAAAALWCDAVCCTIMIVTQWRMRRASMREKNSAHFEPEQLPNTAATVMNMTNPAHAGQEIWLESEAAGQQIVYTTIDDTKKNERPIPAPANELLNVQYATIGQEG